jgi:hypothetical protein
MSGGTPNTKALELPLDGGMDQRQHPRQVQAPLTRQAVNVRWPNLGAVDKRPGNDLVATQFFKAGVASSMVAGQGALMALNNELIVTDGYTVGSLSDSAGTNRIISKGQIPEAVSSSRPVGTTQYFVSQPDVAYQPTTDLLFHVWCANDRSLVNVDGMPRYDIYWCVEDASTGAEIVSSTSSNLGDYWCPRLAVVGNQAIMAYASTPFPPIGTAAVNINCRLWDPVALVWGPPAILVTDSRGTGHAICSDGTNYFMVYETFGETLKVVRINPASAIVTASIISTETIAPTFLVGFSIMATPGERVWVSYLKFAPAVPSGTIRSAAFANDLSSQTTPTFTVHGEPNADTGHTSICRLSSTTACIIGNLGVSTVGNGDARTSCMVAPVVSSSATIVGNATGANRKTFWTVPASGVFVASTSPLRVYVWALVGGARLTSSTALPIGTQPRQWTMMLLDVRADDTTSTITTVRPITWQSPRISLTDSPPIVGAPGSQETFYLPPNVVNVASKTWLTDYIVRKNAATRVGINAATATFGGPNRFVHTTLGDTLYMTPGFTWDRRGFAEIGFSYWPQTVVVTSVGTGGGLVNGKQYSYRVLFEDVDGTGAVHRSQPSDPITVTVAAGAGTAGKATLIIPTMTVTARQSALAADIPQGVRIVVYRAGPLDVDPFTYYRVFSDSLTPKNDPLNPTITVDDIYYDYGTTPAPGGETVQPDTLYTLGGILSNVMPNGFTALTAYHDRIWIAYGNTVAFSKFFVEGEAISFTDAFTIPVEESGDITALWVMDDSLCIATARRVYRLQGNGPSDANTDNDLSKPSRVTTDLGVVDQRSIVVTPTGTMFLSPVGIQILDRSFSVPSEPIGARMRSDLAAYPEITSATMHPTGRYVQFCARETTFGTGIRVIYDYATDRWSRDTVITDNADSGQGILDEIVSRDKVYSLVAQSTNQLYVENPATNLDNGQWVTMRVELAELHPLGLQGHVALRDWTPMAEKHTDHNLNMSWWKDYESASFANRLFKILASDPTENEIREVNLSVHKTRSMRLRLEDAQPTAIGGVTGTGRDATFISISVDIDPLDNKTFKLPAGKKS